MAEIVTILLWILAVLLGLCILAVLFLGICALLVNKKKNYTADSPFYRFLLNCSTALGVKLLGIRVHITGGEMLPEDGRFLLVQNHRSNFDPILTWYIFKEKQLAFISKPENFRIPIFGRIIRKCCFLPIDRENPRNAMKTVQAAAELLKNDMVSVGVYPEGTRSKTGELLPFHNGMFKIAQMAGVPIAVVTIQGTEKIHKNVFRRRSHVQVTVAEVIPVEEVMKCRSAEIGQRVRDTMLDTLEDREGVYDAKL